MTLHSFLSAFFVTGTIFELVSIPYTTFPFNILAIASVSVFAGVAVFAGFEALKEAGA